MSIEYMPFGCVAVLNFPTQTGTADKGKIFAP